MVEIHEIPSHHRPPARHTQLGENPGSFGGANMRSSPPVSTANGNPLPGVDIGQIFSQLSEAWQELEYAQKQQVSCFL